LAAARAIQYEIAGADVDGDVKNLRSRRLKCIAEIRQGLLLTYGLSQRLGMHLYFAGGEDSDYDGAIYWAEGDTAHFQVVQLKELPSETVNQTVTLQEILDSLNKYPDSKDLLVGVYVNRDLTIRLDELRPPARKFAGIYVFSAIAPDQTEWCILGDLQDEGRMLTTFHHPAP